MTVAFSCAECGESLLSGDRFCIHCGAAARSAVSPARTPPRIKPIKRLVPASPSAHPPPLPLPPRDELLERLQRATLGVYDIAGELGRGGMAVVYLAHEIALERKVAIKVLSPALMAADGAIERFKREARTAAQLNHPHIIPIYRVEETTQLVYFVMKFIDGGTLDAVLQRAGPLPVSVTQTILAQVGGALGYAHRHGVVHRDVKPANIILDSEGWAMMSDFGIAKVAQVQGLTMTGSTVGTPTYMSPEQCLAQEEMTGASDQYALGVVAYEMLTGKPPFAADSLFGLLSAHVHTAPRPVQECRSDCPASLSDAVLRMLEKTPEARWPSMAAAVAAIGGGAHPPLGSDAERAQVIDLAGAYRSHHPLAQATAPVSPMPAGRSLIGGGPSGVPSGAASVHVVPPRSTLAVGKMLQLSAWATDSAGSPAGGPVHWASSNPQVATVAPDGRVSAHSPGTVTITATSQGCNAAAAISVTPS